MPPVRPGMVKVLNRPLYRGAIVLMLSVCTCHNWPRFTACQTFARQRRCCQSPADRSQPIIPTRPDLRLACAVQARHGDLHHGQVTQGTQYGCLHDAATRPETSSPLAPRCTHAASYCSFGGRPGRGPCDHEAAGRSRTNPAQPALHFCPHRLQPQPWRLVVAWRGGRWLPPQASEVSS